MNMYSFQFRSNIAKSWIQIGYCYRLLLFQKQVLLLQTPTFVPQKMDFTFPKPNISAPKIDFTPSKIRFLPLQNDYNALSTPNICFGFNSVIPVNHFLHKKISYLQNFHLALKLDKQWVSIQADLFYKCITLFFLSAFYL